MLTWQHSGFSVVASVLISLADWDVPGYFQSDRSAQSAIRPASMTNGGISLSAHDSARTESAIAVLPERNRVRSSPISPSTNNLRSLGKQQLSGAFVVSL